MPISAGLLGRLTASIQGADVDPRPADLDEASRLLADAFRLDPWARHVLGAPGGSRQAALRAIMRVPVRLAAERGGVVVDRGADGSLAAVSTWLPLDQREVTIGVVRRAGALLLPLRAGPVTMRRLTRDEAELDAVLARLLHRPQHPEPDGGGDAYLWVLGAAASARGQGHGRTVVEQTCGEASRSGFGRLVLNTDNPDNVALYRRLGFTLVGTALRRSALTAHVLQRAL